MVGKVLNPWNYDKVVAWEEQNLVQARIDIDKVLQAGITQRVFVPETGLSVDSNDTEFVIKHISDELKLLKQAKPIMMGPATLDSLVNETPDSYECIQHGHLPFDNMFFDFYEPFDTIIPFHDVKAKALGMHLYRSNVLLVPTPRTPFRVHRRVRAEEPCYEANLYLFTEKKMKASVRISFCAKNPSVLCGEVGTMEMGYGYALDVKDDRIRFCQIQYLPDSVTTTEVVDSKLETIANRELFQRIPSLCVNLVNS